MIVLRDLEPEDVRPRALHTAEELLICTRLGPPMYAPHMNPSKIDATLAIMKPDEIREALRFVATWERYGGLDQAEADEWRRRILARKAFLGLEHNYPAS